MFYAKALGEWVRPHPDADKNPKLDPLVTTLYARPDDSAIPKTVTVYGQDEDGNPTEKLVPFHDPILGAAATCDGCGEPFGQQVKIKHQEWVSPTSVLYRTDKGDLRFCQDVYSCSRRASDRLGTHVAKSEMVSTMMAKVSEEAGVTVTDNAEGQIPCAYEKCGKMFIPLRLGQKYHHNGCRVAAEYYKNKAKRPPATRKPGRPKKKNVEAVAAT